MSDAYDTQCNDTLIPSDTAISYHIVSAYHSEVSMPWLMLWLTEEIICQG